MGPGCKEIGWKIAYTPNGASSSRSIFVGLPFVTRTVQPVIEEIEREVEEASATLGRHPPAHAAPRDPADAGTRRADRLCPVLARAVGEYGSVIFIAGNIPLVTEIAPLLIVIQLEEFNYDAAAIGIAMLADQLCSCFWSSTSIQVWSRRRIGYV